MRSPRCLVIVAALGLVTAGAGAQADERDADIAALKRAVADLQAQNRALAERLATLEAGRAAQPDDSRSAIAPPAAASAPQATELAQRVTELERAKVAQEDATRAIIRDSLSTLGSRINESVSLGGSLEVLASRQRDFDGTRSSALQLSTAELDLEIQPSPWVIGNLVISYSDGGDVEFTDSRGGTSGVDRLTVDTASITVGDLQRFPLLLRAGRMNLAFGSSTGVHRSDVLSIENPLTTDAFETRRNAIGIGFGLPTPEAARAPLPVVVPAVQPQLLTPLVTAFGRQLGYAPPPARPARPSPVSLPVEPPPFYGGILMYQGDDAGARPGFLRNVNTRLGWRAGGHCGKPYGDLRASDLCPWAMDVSVDHIGSVFDSLFLASEYRRFLDQFGPVRGLASTLKLTLGPWLLVGEWNGATSDAVFDDDLGRRVRIRPSAWQLSTAYQFDWNPWVETIGGQGTYVAFGYSRSRDLAGATGLVASEPVRVGFLPQSRWTLTAGEWVAEGLKVQLEYSYAKDYGIGQGGTGGSASGLQMMLTYGW